MENKYIIRSQTKRWQIIQICANNKKHETIDLKIDKNYFNDIRINLWYMWYYYDKHNA